MQGKYTTHIETSQVTCSGLLLEFSFLLTHMRRFERFGTIGTILKNVKNTLGGGLLLIKLQAEVCNCNKSDTTSWIFFTFFQLYK